MPANTLQIAEFNFTTIQTSLAQVAKVPPSASGTLGVTAGSLRSGVLGSATNMVRLHTTANCCVKFGDINVAATTSDIPLAAGSTEYFQVTPGTYIAVIADP